MMKFYFVRSLMALLIIGLSATNSQSQTIIPGGNPSRFGIDGDVKSDTFAFGTSMPSPVNSDDWFKKAGGTGLGVIDTTGAAYAKTRLQNGGDYIFNLPAMYPRFSVQNGNLLLDSRYARDGAMIDSTFFSGNAQNGQDPTTWPGSTSGGSPLDKCDIVDTYIHLRRDGTVLTGPNPSHLYLMLGASMVATNGSHYMDFELYKQQMYYDRVLGRFKNTGPTNTGGHTIWAFDPDGTVNEMGDMQVSFTYSSSSVSSINIYIWVPLQTYNTVNPKYFDFVPNTFIPGTLSGYGYAEITANQPGAALPVWGLVNPVQIPGPTWGTTSKDLGNSANNYYSADYAPGQFAEIGIDFTALGTDPAFNPYNNPCTPPFTRVIAKTRSSGSFSAALKDFTGPFPFVVDFTPPPTITPPTNLACNIAIVNVKPDTLVTPGEYQWSTSDGNITTRTDTPYIKVNTTGTYVLKTRTFLGCSSRSDSVDVTKDDNKPIATAGGPYYVTVLNPIAQLQGGDAAASNYSTPYGNSQGLLWKWTGPLSFLKNTQVSDADVVGTYTLTLTELRNGCTETANANVIFLSTLPIKLNTFDAASVNKNTVDVKWTATSEDGNEKYILERSVNGITFSPVYNIAAAKASSLSNYGYRDDVTGLTTTNFIYYRVKIYSHGALYSISNVVKINSKPDQVHNYISSVTQSGPKTNPVVNFYSTIAAPVLLKVVDVDGKVLIKTYVQTNAGLNSVALPAGQINTLGVKFIQMAIQQDKLNYKFFFK
ncbi:MAG TPA: hypothetical protein VMY77_02245 [Chitinophagaceae bacterium]|nr:hypothetical protein [Chitinophagaceae bacterium]